MDSMNRWFRARSLIVLEKVLKSYGSFSCFALLGYPLRNDLKGHEATQKHQALELVYLHVLEIEVLVGTVHLPPELMMLSALGLASWRHWHCWRWRTGYRKLSRMFRRCRRNQRFWKRLEDCLLLFFQCFRRLSDSSSPIYMSGLLSEWKILLLDYMLLYYKSNYEST